MPVEFRELDQDALERLAVKLAASMEPGDVILLSGEVGAGKTTFTRAACANLGVKERVSSPTFQIARSYEGLSGDRPITVNHLDLYRLDGIGLEDALDLDDYLTPDSITFIEWAEPALDAVQNPSVIGIEHDSPETRNVTVTGSLAARITEKSAS